MKIGTSLGTVVPMVTDINELYNMMAHDAKVVGKEVQNKLQAFNIRVG